MCATLNMVRYHSNVIPFCLGLLTDIGCMRWIDGLIVMLDILLKEHNSIFVGLT